MERKQSCTLRKLSLVAFSRAEILGTTTQPTGKDHSFHSNCANDNCNGKLSAKARARLFKKSSKKMCADRHFRAAKVNSLLVKPFTTCDRRRHPELAEISPH